MQMTEELTVVSESITTNEIVNVETQEDMNNKDKDEVQVQGVITKVVPPKNILVIGKDDNGDNVILFEGESSLTRVELTAEYGEDVTVYYQQQYTTVSGDESYDEAILNTDNYKKLCYTKDEFTSSLPSDIQYSFLTYSHRDLTRQKRLAEKETKKVISPTKGQEMQPNFSLYLLTSMKEVRQNNKSRFPIPNLSAEQIKEATVVLNLEDYYKFEYELQEGDHPSIKEQQEAILFIVGTPEANDNYIKISRLRWLTETDDKKVIKGLIKNNINSNGVQVYMLRINVRDKRNTEVLLHCNYK